MALEVHQPERISWLTWIALIRIYRGMPRRKGQAGGGGEDTGAGAGLVEKGKTVTHVATGTFEVMLAPQPAHSSQLGRMTIDKRFQGDLEATSVGEMLSAMGGVQGSAGYVAMEVVRGSLSGKSGSFVLQHSATMNRGAPSLSVTVVPDSGTDGLTGMTGKMGIIIQGKEHSYRFEYSLPA